MKILNSKMYVLICSIILLTGCSVNKIKHVEVSDTHLFPYKKYAKIEQIFASKDEGVIPFIEPSVGLRSENSEIVQKKEKRNTSKAKPKFIKIIKNLLKPMPIDSCDVIITKDGEEIICKVEIIDIDVIKYRKCSDEKSPLISVLKSDMFLIKYANGEKYVLKDQKKSINIEDDKNISESNSSNKKKKIDGFGLAGFLISSLSIPFWWFYAMYIGMAAGVIAIIFGIISIRRIIKKRESRKGLGLAILSLVLGGLLVAISLLLILLLL